jgi:quercetin dioxygenase-like cupin family protein
MGARPPLLLTAVRGIGTMGARAALILVAGFSTSALGADIAADVTTINGLALPAVMRPLQDVSTMLDTVDANGNRLFITKGTRLAGTRVAIHMHLYGGHTCVLTGEITDYVEGSEPAKHPAGTCYYMPPNIPMSAANLGVEDAVLIDTFNLPFGVPYITILEAGYPSN